MLYQCGPCCHQLQKQLCHSVNRQRAHIYHNLLESHVDGVYLHMIVSNTKLLLKFKQKRHHLTGEGRGSQVHAQCNPQLHWSFRYRLCFLPLGLPSVSTLLSEGPHGHKAAGICISIKHNEGIQKKTETLSPKPTNKFPLLGRNWVTCPFLNQSLAREGEPP